MVDDAHEIIAAIETTTGAVDEGARLLALIEAHEDSTGQAVRTAIADAHHVEKTILRLCSKHDLIGQQPVEI